MNVVKLTIGILFILYLAWRSYSYSKIKKQLLQKMQEVEKNIEELKNKIDNRN